MKIIRVFPRRTKLTPDDENVRVACVPGLFDEADEVHVSVLFKEDLPKAERLAKEWSKVALVKIGGVITSRGCVNQCWFCDAWRNEGNEIRELPITDGWNVMDNNLLRCSENHVRKVFEMLHRQPERARFTGGFEAKALQDWHVDLLARLRLQAVFFAYDRPADLDSLRSAGKRLLEAGFTIESRKLQAYCLIGWRGDSLDRAETRLRQCFEAGFIPFAMLYRDGKNEPSKDWKRLARVWARPAIIFAKMKGEKL